MSASTTSLSRLVPLARFVYRATPFLPLRKLYYRAFARLVRARRVQREIDGATYELDLGETIDLNLFLGEFERDIHDAVAELCRPGMVVADVGANVGAHSLLFARAVAPDGMVLAFEPTEYAFAKLQRNVSLNPWAHVRMERIALSDTAAPPTRVEFRSSWPTSGPRRDGPSTVAFLTLDEWLARNGIGRIDLMKLDVDGFEWNVLAGARAMLSSSRPLILLEASPQHFAGSRNPVALLFDLGYQIENARTRQHYESSLEIAMDLTGIDSVNLICRP